ncbi:acid phosphatase 1 [Silene latifolia]|uniref:acid phosphatase 1 n=1 Tax=Silene latifolia TaxID=37657 RepID=UPI003D789618
MKTLLISALILSIFSITFSSQDSLNHHQFPRPLILEYTDGGIQQDDELYLKCTSWRFGVEANNLNPWKSIPKECGDYVKNYVLGKGYKLDLENVFNEASIFAKSVLVGDDGKDVWVFDVDETLISNLPYYVDHGYGLEVFDSTVFNKWVEKGMAPAIETSLKLYEEVLSLGFKVILLTGRNEKQRDVTVQNLMNVGFSNWDKLILREAGDNEKTATTYKSEKRDEMVKEGYRIVGNSGDQWSDLLGSSMSFRSFKLPNPMYYIP